MEPRRFEWGSPMVGLRKTSSPRAFGHQGDVSRLDRATHWHRTVMDLFSKSSCTLVPHSETQSVLPHQGKGSSKTFSVFTC
jgi:hypothetical protein